MLAIEEQLRQYGAAVEESLLDSFDSNPSVPVDVGPEEQRPPGRRRPRRVRYLVGAAVAASVIAAIVVVVDPSSDRVVSTPSDSTSDVTSTPLLTLGQPQGQVWRRVLPISQSHVAEFRRVDPPTGTTLVIFPAVRPDDPTTTRRSGDRSFVTPAEPSPSRLVWLTWSEADGTYWSLYTQLGALPPQHELDEFFAALHYQDGEFSAAPPYEAYSSWTMSPIAWALEDDVSLVVAVQNSDFETTDLVGRHTMVRGRPAVFADDGSGVLWRENADTVISLNTSPRRFDQAGHGTRLTEADLIRIAEELDPISRAQFDALPVNRGSMGVPIEQQRINVVAPKDAGVVTLEAQEIRADTQPSSRESADIDADGVALPIRPGIIGYYLWTSDGGARPTVQLLSSPTPPCAQRVDVPDEGEPPVFVTVDPACTG